MAYALSRSGCDSVACILQALVYNIRLPTTAITDSTIGLEELSAKGRVFLVVVVCLVCVGVGVGGWVCGWVGGWVRACVRACVCALK